MGEESNSILLLFLYIHVHLKITFHLQYIVTYFEECEFKKKNLLFLWLLLKFPLEDFTYVGLLKKKRQ